MKVARTFTIEHDLIEQLMEEENQSKLINTLLQQHYNSIKVKQNPELQKKYEELLQIKKDKLIKQQQLKQQQQTQYNKENKELNQQCKSKKISFDQYYKQSKILKDKYGQL